MKKYFLIFIVGISSAFSMQMINDSADSFYSNHMQKKLKSNAKQNAKESIGLSLAFKPAYFWPQDKVYRDIYDGGFTGLVEICYDMYHGLNLFCEIGYFYKKDRITSIDTTSSTIVEQVPLSLGLNYIYAFNDVFSLYVKMSPNYLYTHTKVYIPHLQEKVAKHTFGGTFGFGGRIFLIDEIFFEPFMNYLLDKRKITDGGETFRVWLGGIQVGLGLGFYF